MAGSIVRFICGKLSKKADVAAALTPEKILACNPEEETETSSMEIREHKLKQEAVGK